MALGAFFTTNLEWANEWSRLKEGCTAHMQRLGAKLATVYEEQNL